MIKVDKKREDKIKVHFNLRKVEKKELDKKREERTKVYFGKESGRPK